MHTTGAAALPSEIVDRLDRLLGTVARRRFVLGILVLLVFVIAFNGLGVVPHEPYRLVSQDPFRRVAAYDTNTFQESPLLPLVAHFTRLTSGPSFNSLCLAIALAGFCSFAFLSRKRLGPEPALLSTGLLLAHPVTLVLLSWLGTPDCITFLLSTVMLFTRSYVVVAIVSLLGAFNHPAMLFIAPLVLLLRRMSREKGIGYQHLVASGVGLVLGTLAVRGYLAFYGIETFSRLDFIFTRTFLGWVRYNLSNLPLALFSLHSTIWVALVVCVLPTFSKDRRYFVTFFLGQLLLYGVTFFSQDTTRVFSILAWAPAFHCITYALQLADGSERGGGRVQLRKILLVIAVVGLVKPNYYIWDTAIYGPPFSGFYIPVLESLRRLFPLVVRESR